MWTMIIIVGCFALLSCMNFCFAEWEWKRYIERLSKNTNIDEINDFIQKGIQKIDNGEVTNDFEREYLANKVDLWIQVREYILNKNTD